MSFRVRPLLDNYYFPTNIFNNSFLEEVLIGKRNFSIRTAITTIDLLNNHNRNEFMIEYKVPWCEEKIIDKESIDMVFSQALLQADNDLKDTYNKLLCG